MTYLGGPGQGCNVADGQFDQGQTISDIDFILQPLGSISGRVVDNNDDPISGIRLTLYTFQGNRRAETLSDAQGFYEFIGLGTTRLYLIAGGEGYLTKIFDDLPCTKNCDPVACSQPWKDKGSLLAR